MSSHRANDRKGAQGFQSGHSDVDLPEAGQSDGKTSEPAPERRRQPPPTTPHDHLQQLPALPLLNRLPTPVVAIGLDGKIVYANPAFAAWLGYPDVLLVTGQPLCLLLADHEHTPAHDCFGALRAAAGTVAAWCHADGYHQQAVVSEALLVRATDPLLLVTLTDVSDLLWNSKP